MIDEVDVTPMNHGWTWQRRELAGLLRELPPEVIIDVLRKVGTERPELARAAAKAMADAPPTVD